MLNIKCAFPALLTHFVSNSLVDEEPLHFNVEGMKRAAVHGLVVCETTSEPLLTSAERMKSLETFLNTSPRFGEPNA